MPTERRIERINESIGRIVGEALLELGNLSPHIFISVVGVKIAPNLARVTVRYSVFPDKEAERVARFLASQRVLVQEKINDALHLRRTPVINFERDQIIAVAEALRHESGI